MSTKTFTKGNANRETLSDRMKKYEAVTTETCLIERLPIYARVDMRAGHSFCRGLDKPFDDAYSKAMASATAFIVEKTGAAVGYTQSDEASFVWLDHTKLPFGTRLFKLQSVFASMFTAAFMKACIGTKLEEKLSASLPSFDCRVFNMPSLDECANMILWRERDSVKNSITLLALEHFSTKQIDKKNSADKVKMLAEIGVDYYAVLTPAQRRGSYFRRELYDKVLTAADLAMIPEKSRPEPDGNGVRKVTRSHVVEFSLEIPLEDVMNKVNALFFKELPVRIDDERISGEV